MILAWSVITALNFASIAGYIALSITLNGSAPYWQFNGTAFIIQPVSESTADKVQLVILDQTGGGHPGLAYDISACGPRPYSADLVLTGDARINPLRVSGMKPPEFPLIQEYFDWFYGDVQVARLDLPKAPCPIRTFEETDVYGFLYGPVQQNWSGPWGLWQGPHASQSWPQLGLISDPTSIASFGFTWITGKWTVPSSLNIEVQEPAFPGWSIDSSIPGTPVPNNPPDTPSWSGTKEISPSAQLTDTASVALLQDWIVVSAIGFGVGGAMLASLVFDWIRPGAFGGSSDQRVLAGSGVPVGGLQQPNRMKGRVSTWIILLLAFIVGCARRREHRRLP
jgi:hypothetical protein